MRRRVVDRTDGVSAATGVLVVLAWILALVSTACDAAPPAQVRVEPLAAIPGDAPGLPDVEQFLAEIDRSRGHRDMFQVLHDPELLRAAEAPGMAEFEEVLGLDLGVAQVAYPVNYLNHHEIVEHTVAGLDLLVCW